MDGGGFEILWTSEGSPADPDHWSVQRRPFAAGRQPGRRRDPGQHDPAPGAGAPGLDASMTRHGDMVAAWDAWAFEVRARVFRNTLLVDGFETGGASAWSFAQP